MVPAIGVVAGQFLSSYLGSKFTLRYSAVKNAFTEWQNEARDTFWRDLKGQVKEKAPPTEIHRCRFQQYHFQLLANVRGRIR
jgi:hypothetical protein